MTAIASQREVRSIIADLPGQATISSVLFFFKKHLKIIYFCLAKGHNKLIFLRSQTLIANVRNESSTAL